MSNRAKDITAEDRASGIVLEENSLQTTKL